MRNYFGISDVTTHEEVSRKFLRVLESVWGLAVLGLEAFLTQLQSTKDWWVTADRPQSGGSRVNSSRNKCEVEFVKC